MGFLASVTAAVIEFVLAQIAKIGMSQIHQYESEAQAKEKALLDSQALAAAKDRAARVAALKQVSGDLFENDDSDTKPTN